MSDRDEIAGDAVARTLRAYENPRVRAVIAAGALAGLDAKDLLDLAIVAFDQASTPVEVQHDLHQMIDTLTTETS
jgi:hypothetical protein